MKFIDIHTHNSTVQEDVIKIVNLFPEAQDLSDIQHYASVGLHPWYIKKDFNAQLLLLDNLALNLNIIAIGEAGLDLTIDIDSELQNAIFLAQAAIAETLAKPMIIHAVRTYYDIIAVRKFYSDSPAWIIHGFTGNDQVAKALLKNNFYLSFGKDLFNEKRNASKVITTIPLSNIFLETDDSGFDIRNIYEKAADILNISVEDLCLQLSSNFKRLFQIDLNPIL